MDDSLGFWEAFFLLLIWIPLILVWIFALVDIFRRDDISGGMKALWVVVVILLPFVGTLIYLLFRKPGATKFERAVFEEADRTATRGKGPTVADQLARLSELHLAGRLTDEEWAAAKAQLLAGAGDATTVDVPSGPRAFAPSTGGSSAPMPPPTPPGP
jgi:hypothetical protein